MPSYKPSTENNFLSVSNAMRRPIAESTMDCVFPIWHTTHIHRKNVGDSVRAVCGDKLHVWFGRGDRGLEQSRSGLLPYGNRWRSLYQKGGFFACDIIASFLAARVTQ